MWSFSHSASDADDDILWLVRVWSVVSSRGLCPCVGALLFLTHKSTGFNKIFYCQNLSSRLGNFYNAPELHMKYPQLSSGDREKCIRPELLGSRLVKLYKTPELDIKHD